MSSHAGTRLEVRRPTSNLRAAIDRHTPPCPQPVGNQVLAESIRAIEIRSSRSCQDEDSAMSDVSGDARPIDAS